MGLFGGKEQDGRYHATNKAADWALTAASTEQIRMWAEDLLCIEQAKCAEWLPMRLKREEDERQAQEAAAILQAEKEKAALQADTKRKLQLEAYPFDIRNEISADARYIAGRIVTALWVIFILIPIVLSILFEILK